MCSQDIIAQHHKQFGHRLFTVHSSVFVLPPADLFRGRVTLEVNFCD